MKPIWTGGLALLLLGTAPAGRALEMLEVRPEGRSRGPCILFAPGNGTMEDAQRVAQMVGRPLAERGWTVFVPVAPEGRSYFGSQADAVAEWIDGLRRRDDLPWGKILFAGVSNGGASALEHAARMPDRTAGVLAIPGMVSATTRLEDLRGVPIFLRVGDRDDLNWHRAYEGQVKGLMRIGAPVDARLLADTGHRFRPPWDEIDLWLSMLEANSVPAAPGIVSAVDGEIRVWRARNGDAVPAMLDEEQGPMVQLRRPDGETVRIAVANLSREDQWWLAERRHRRQTSIRPSFNFGDGTGGGARIGPEGGGARRPTPPAVNFPQIGR